MTYDIIPASQIHVGSLMSQAHNLCVRILREGGSPRRKVRELLTGSRQAWTAMENGRPVAMWGVMGTLAAPVGVVWLIVADGVRSRRFAIVREARDYLRFMLETRSELVSVIPVAEDRALRFARFMGFQVAEQPHREGDALYFRIWMTRDG